MTDDFGGWVPPGADSVGIVRPTNGEPFAAIAFDEVLNWEPPDTLTRQFLNGLFAIQSKIDQMNDQANFKPGYVQKTVEGQIEGLIGSYDAAMDLEIQKAGAEVDNAVAATRRQKEGRAQSITNDQEQTRARYSGATDAELTAEADGWMKGKNDLSPYALDVLCARLRATGQDALYKDVRQAMERRQVRYEAFQSPEGRAAYERMMTLISRRKGNLLYRSGYDPNGAFRQISPRYLLDFGKDHRRADINSRRGKFKKEST